MPWRPRLTPCTIEVFKAILDVHPDGAYSAGISERIAMNRGTVTSVLHRLEDHGWAVSSINNTAPHQGRNRRYYHLTERGLAGLCDALGRRDAGQ